MDYAIGIENLTKTYGKHRGVENVNLSIEEGQWMGFIGPNGAGKSTVIRTLLGSIKPTAGKCTVFGLDSWTQRDKIMAQVGYLPSEAIFYQNMTVRQTLEYAMALHNVKDLSRMKELSGILELDLKRKIGELSYGNRKKVGIVASLAHSPRLLVLDEPTGGLDPLMQSRFFELLEEEHKKGTTIFMSSHILSEIEHHAQIATFIKEGHIILQKSVHEMGNRSTRKVSVLGSVDLSGVSGIRDVREQQNGVSFLFSGKASDLANVLAKGNVQDFTVTEPELDELFMHFYEKEARV